METKNMSYFVAVRRRSIMLLGALFFMAMQVASAGMPSALYKGALTRVGTVNVSSAGYIESTNISHGLHPIPFLTVYNKAGALEGTAPNPQSLYAAGFSTSSSSSTSNTQSISETSPGFIGLNESQSGWWYPPDPQIGVGPSYTVEMVNNEVQIKTKPTISPSNTYNLTTNQFFKANSADGLSDPRIMYDALDGRWFASIIDVSLYDVYVAISSTSDPTGTWTVYAYKNGANLPDQPILGLSSDKVLVSFNDFYNGQSFLGAQYVIMNKSQMLSGSLSANVQVSSIISSGASIHPARSLGTTNTLYMVSVGFGGTNVLQLFAVNGAVPNATVTEQNFSASASVPPDAQQPGTGSLLATGDARIQDALWSNGRLWLAFNDACVPTGDSTRRSCIHLMELDTNTHTTLQNFDVAEYHAYLFYPAISVDSQGNLGMVFGYSSSKYYPSLALTGQKTTDPSNTVESFVTLKAGSGPDTSGRYGDYYGAATDPSNPQTIWGVGEFTSNKSSTYGWSTYIGSFSLTSNVPLSIAAPTPASQSVAQGTNAIINDTGATGGTAPYAYTWLEKAPGSSAYSMASDCKNPNSTTCLFITSSSTITGTYSFELQATDSTLTTVTSSAANVIVNPSTISPLVIAAPLPSSQTIQKGQTATITSSGASGGIVPYTYQWLEEAPGQSSYTNAVNCASPSSTTCTFQTYRSTRRGTYSFELQVTDSALSIAVSSSAIVTVVQ